MEIWEKFYKQMAIGSNSTFLKTFHNLNNEQLMFLRDKFEFMADKYTLPHEFAGMIALSSTIQERLTGKREVSLNQLADLMDKIPRDEGLTTKIRQLLAIYQDIDSYNQNQVNWSTFSQAVQQMAKNTVHQSCRSLYYPHQQYIPILSQKITDPIYNITYSQQSRSFMVCCKDNSIYQLSPTGRILKPLKGGHTSLPLSCISIHPYVEHLYEYSANATLNSYNFISSGADRKIIVWNMQYQPISYVTSYNIVNNLAQINQVVYRGQLVQPAIFGGDDAGNVNFYMLEGQRFKLLDDPQRNLTVFAEEDDLNIKMDQFLDIDIEKVDDESETPADDGDSDGGNDITLEPSANTAYDVSDELQLKKQQRFERQRRMQDVQQRLQQATQTTKLSPTPIWTCHAHDGWSSCLLVEHMNDSDSYLLVSGGTDGSLVSIDIDQGQIQTNYLGHTSAVAGVTWLHNRSLMISVGKDRQLNVWPSTITTQTIHPIAKFLGSDQPYVGVFASVHNQEFFTVDITGTVKQWDVRRLTPVDTIVGNQTRNGKACCAAFDVVSGSIAIGSSLVGITQKQNQNQQVQISLNSVQQLKASATVPGIVIAADNRVQFWDLLHGIQTQDFDSILQDNEQTSNLGQVLGQINNSDQLGQNVMQNLDQPFSSDKYGQIQLQDLKNMDIEQPKLEYQENGQIFVEKQINSVAISPNNQLFAISSGDSDVSVYQCQNGLELFKIRQHGEEISNIPEKFVEANQNLMRQQNIITKEKQKLQYVKENDLILGREDYKYQRNQTKLGGQKTVPCTNLFFGYQPNKLNLWLCYGQTNQIVCYQVQDNKQQKYQSLGKYVSKFKWKEINFLPNQNLVVVNNAHEINAVQQDGSLLCKCMFKSTPEYEIRHIQTIESAIIVYQVHKAQLVVRVIDTHCFAIIAEAQISDLSSEQLNTIHQVQTSLFSSTLLLVLEDGTIYSYQLEKLYEIYQTFHKLIVANPSAECKIQLSRQYGCYTRTYTTRRQHININELREEFQRHAEREIMQLQREMANNQLLRALYQDEVIGLTARRLQRYNTVESGGKEIRLSELCMLEVVPVEVCGIFAVSTGLGQVLVINAGDGSFMQFLSFGGWSRQNKQLIRELIRRQPQTQICNHLICTNKKNEALAHAFIGEVCREVQQSVQQSQVHAAGGSGSERQRINVAGLSRQLQAEMDNNRARMKMESRAGTQHIASTKEATVKINQMYESVKQQYRSVSQLQGLKRTLPDAINKENVREKMAEALSKVDIENAKERFSFRGIQQILPKQRALSPMRFGSRDAFSEASNDSARGAKIVVPSILTMSPDDIRKNFGENAAKKYKPSAVLKKPTRVYWNSEK